MFKVNFVGRHPRREHQKRSRMDSSHVRSEKWTQTRHAIASRKRVNWDTRGGVGAACEGNRSFVVAALGIFRCTVQKFPPAPRPQSPQPTLHPQSHPLNPTPQQPPFLPETPFDLSKNLCFLFSATIMTFLSLLLLAVGAGKS